MERQNGQCRLYIISPPALDPLIFSPLLARTLDAGDVACFQLRLAAPLEEETGKEGSTKYLDRLLRAIEILMPITHQRGVAFMVNDHVEAVRKMGCDGVHLGTRDMSVRQARQILGAEKIIGATCMNSKHLAMTAAESSADYVSFGPFYPSRSPFYPPEVFDPANTCDLGLLTWWQETMEVPCVAVGGIKPSHAPTLAKAGADFIATMSALWENPTGAPTAVKTFQERLGE